MKIFNYLEAPCNRENQTVLSYETMLYLQTICNFIDWMVFERAINIEIDLENMVNGMVEQVEEYDPSKSEYFERVTEDVRYLCEFHEVDVENLRHYNEKAYDLLLDICADIYDADVNHTPSFEDLIQLRKELAEIEF